jgi:signal transduction histidine kinase
VREVTKRFENLNLTPEVLRSILNFLPYPFLLSRKIGGVVQPLFVNDKFLGEIGYTTGELPTQQAWFERAYPDVAYREVIFSEWQTRVDKATVENSQHVSMQVVIQTKNFGPQWYEVSSSLFAEIEVVAFININKVKTNEAKLEDENRNRDKILSVLSHDLRGPMNNLISLTKLFRNEQLKTDEIRKIMMGVHGDVIHSVELLETLLTWTRSNFSRIAVEHKQVDLRHLFFSILDLFRPALDAKQMGIELNLFSGPFYSDPAILNIVMRNLVSNAIKFSPSGAKISIESERNVDHLKVRVRDWGEGMDEEAIRFITTDQSFSRAGTHREQGFGLGLRLCREFLPLVNGHLEIESSPGHGTIMIVTLPFRTE